jgi:uncharacterized protein (TIGR02646 family)
LIQLYDSPLPLHTENELAQFQAIVDRQEKYSERIQTAKNLFTSKNVQGNRTFDVVKIHLDRMCSGARRCAYCEDSCADEVEHIWPKNIYPEHVFQWPNYLYACGPCNGPKGDKFAIYRERDGRRVDITPGYKRLRSIPPPSGSPLLIDPRQEDPLDYLKLDLLMTFRFFPIGPYPSRAWQRAKYTIEVLRLNDRAPLVRSRRAAFIAYRSILGNYIRRRDSDERQDALDELVTGIYEQSNITVWREMQRQWPLIPELRDLFTIAPEALEW